MYNKVMLVGRLARDPELKEFSNGGSVCKIRLITSSAWRDRKSGEMRERTEGHNVAIYVDKLGRRIADACVKGDILLVEGSIETRRYTNGDGEQRYITEIAVRPFEGRVRRMPTPERRETAGEGGAVEAAAAADTLADTEADVFDDWLSDDMESLGDGDDFPF